MLIDKKNALLYLVLLIVHLLVFVTYRTEVDASRRNACKVIKSFNLLLERVGSRHRLKERGTYSIISIATHDYNSSLMSSVEECNFLWRLYA